jgi:hypothetical protein
MMVYSLPQHTTIFDLKMILFDHAIRNETLVACYSSLANRRIVVHLKIR